MTVSPIFNTDTRLLTISDADFPGASVFVDDSTLEKLIPALRRIKARGEGADFQFVSGDARVTFFGADSSLQEGPSGAVVIYGDKDSNMTKAIRLDLGQFTRLLNSFEGI